MNARLLRGDASVSSLDPCDRGLAYGDGVFETLLVHDGQPVWWDEHWRRMRQGAEALALPLPSEARLRGEAATLLRDAPARCVLKIVCTRGVGGRGYRPPAVAEPSTVLSWHEAPAPVAPVNLRWCQTTWAVQPRLAGIKHLNRLEQVLARAEWDDPDIFEGIACDTEDRVVSATSANLFARIGERWLTPRVHRCGVAGIARAWVLGNLAGAAEADLSAAEISRADALFLCNAVRGILPVRRLGLREWPDDPAVASLRRKLGEAQPAFAIQES